MSFTSSSGRTKKFDFFHWLTKSECAAEMKYNEALRIPIYVRPEWLHLHWRALRKQNKSRPFPIDPKAS